MKLIILSWAEQDLLNGRDFYDAQEPGVGEYFLDCLSADIESLAYYAGIHRKVGRYYRALSRVFPYALYYKIDEEEVRVWAVLDCRRDPAWISRQLRLRT
jgi:plasmid stabilization system protein ParE